MFQGPNTPGTLCAGLYHPKTNSSKATLKSEATSTIQEPSSSHRHSRNSLVPARSSKELLVASRLSLLGDLTKDHLIKAIFPRRLFGCLKDNSSGRPLRDYHTKTKTIFPRRRPPTEASSIRRGDRRVPKITPFGSYRNIGAVYGKLAPESFSLLDDLCLPQ